MYTSIVDSIQGLVHDQLSGSGEPESLASHDEMTGELELWAGKALLERGALETAFEFLVRAAGHLDEPARKVTVVEQLVRLAKTCTDVADGTNDPVRAESVLSEAARIAPLYGLPELAQYLRRSGRLPEAIECWREAVRVDAGNSDYYLRLGDAYAQAGEPESALGSYLEAVAVAPTARSYLTVGQRLTSLAPNLPVATARAIKIALLGNSTLDHLQQYLKVECYRAGLRPSFYQCGFDQYTQDILNPASGLYRFAPDVVICAIHASQLFPRLHHYPFELAVEERKREVDRGLATVQNLLDTLTTSTTALVLFHNMVAPQHPALGTQDWRDNLGQAELFHEANARLAAMVRQRYNNVYVLDEDAVQARTGKERATDARLWFTARMGWSDAVLPALAREHMRYLTPYKGLSRKCIVLDLDNTLWGGVIGEDGIEGIQLGPEAPGNAFVAFQRELERLWHRGILLAICSKNNEADVLPVFDRHPHTVLKLSHFAARRVNWQSKAMNLREIAAELNIGLDSLVFLDDNPAERAAVRAELPQVLTIDLPIDPAHYRATLLGLDVFETLALTEDDLLRNERYTAQTARREFESQYVESHVPLEVYLADLQLRVEIDRINQQTLPRVAQLTNKTNQFNLTTHRYSEAEILEMQARGFEGFSARVMDRFGDNGVVGVTIVRRDGLVMEIDTFLLSCRVMGRGVETAILSFLATLASQDGLQRLRGWYLPTEKNAPVKDCYRQHGFKLVEQGPGGGELWELDLADAAVPSPPWLSVDAPSSGT